MNEISHRILIRGRLPDVFKALSTVEGLAKWWTQTTSGKSEPGSKINFRFGDHVSTMQVETLTPDRLVEWECLGSAPDWVGTKLSFDLQEDEGGTVVNFRHHEWREVNAFFGHCSMKWAVFLLSLKQYVESGIGSPFPNDIAV